MKNRSRQTTCLRAAVFIVAALVATSGMAQINNTGTGDIAGVDADLDDSNTFVLNLTTLGLVKTAFLTDGTQLTTDDSVPKGTLVKFMIYVDNTTDVQVNNVNVEDILDAAFTYQAGTIKVSAAADTGDTEADIYTAVNGSPSFLDDGEDNTDVAGFDGTNTISAGLSAGNLQVDVPANKVWAILFTVQM